MTKRSSLILLELMAALLFFALAGSVCISILAKADTLSAQSTGQNRAIRTVTSAAELIRGADSDAQAWEAVAAFWPQASRTDPMTVTLEEGSMTLFREQAGPITRYHIHYSGPVEYSLTLERFYGEAGQ